ncbi:MAG: hypothetical protein AB7Q97_05390 [Gammaproteobacteria bacterium]
MVKRYPAIELVARHGRTGALVLGLLSAAGAIGGFLMTHAPGRLIGGLLSAAVLYGLLRVGAELVEVIAETLLPR